MRIDSSAIGSSPCASSAVNKSPRLIPAADNAPKMTAGSTEPVVVAPDVVLPDGDVDVPVLPLASAPVASDVIAEVTELAVLPLPVVVLLAPVAADTSVSGEMPKPWMVVSIDPKSMPAPFRKLSADAIGSVEFAVA